MGKLIAVAGKGGAGKSTVAALVVRYLLERRLTPVLAVDADPNYTLGDGLGIPVENTIGMLREGFINERASLPAGMSRDAYLESQLQAGIHESQGVDLLVMGRQEGPGCYCALNNILRRFLDRLAADYRFAVVDNEAGMEHLSRRNTRKIDLLLVVADHTVKATRAAGRIVELIDELRLEVADKYLVLNRSPAQIAPEVQGEIDRSGLPLLVTLPEDPEVRAADAQGKSLLTLSESALCVSALHAALQRIIS